MHQLIITKENLAAMFALKAGRTIDIELTDRETEETPEGRQRERAVPIRAQGLVGGGIALFEVRA